MSLSVSESADSEIAIQTVFFVSSALASIYALYRIHTSLYKIRRNSKWILVAQISNFSLQTFFVIVLWLSRYHGQDSWPDIAIPAAQNILIVSNVFFAQSLDLEILSLFSVFSLKLERFIPYIMPFIYGNFALLGLPAIVMGILIALPTPNPMFDLDTYFALIYCGIGAVFDNAATIYVTWLVYRKSQIRAEARKKGLLGRLIVMIVAKCLIDWTCISLVAATDTSSRYYIVLVNIAASLAGIHVAIIALILIELQKLALEHALHRYQSTQRLFQLQGRNQNSKRLGMPDENLVDFKSPEASCGSPVPDQLEVADQYLDQGKSTEKMHDTKSYR